MVMSLRERRRQMLRAEILQATRELVAEKGYAAMSMDELAARVGISKPTLYSHFTTKEDLIIAAAQQAMQRLLDILETAPPDHTPMQKLLLLLRTAIHSLFEEGIMPARPITPELIHLVRSHEETRACIQRIDTTIIELVQQAIQQGEIDPSLDMSTVVLAFHGLIHALKTEYFCQVHIPEPDIVAATLETIFERGVRKERLSSV